MNKLILLVILAVGGKFGYDAFMAGKTDRDMARAVKEMNAKLPISTEHVRLEQVAYSERTLRVSGRLLSSQPLTEDARVKSRAKLMQDYCSFAPVQAAKVGVVYSFAKVSLASMSDKVKADNWEVALQPDDCK